MTWTVGEELGHHPPEATVRRSPPHRAECQAECNFRSLPSGACLLFRFHPGVASKILRIKELVEFSGSGGFRFGSPRVAGLTTEGTEGHRGLLGHCAFRVGLGTLVVHSPRFTQVDFSVKVRCHKKKVNIGLGCGELLWDRVGLTRWMRLGFPTVWLVSACTDFAQSPFCCGWNTLTTLEKAWFA
jgi:hypothetical protein